MTYQALDADELLKLALDAMNTGRDADAIVMLKNLVEREPDHAMARYLLAAQHAQLGLMDKAEAGFRDVVSRAPDFPMARFQLGQLLIAKGQGADAAPLLEPIAEGEGAVAHYARGLLAAAREDAPAAIASFREGLGLPQDVPALADDMRRLLSLLEAQTLAPAEVTSAPPMAAPIFLTGYGQARAD